MEGGKKGKEERKGRGREENVREREGKMEERDKMKCSKWVEIDTCTQLA